MTATSYLLDLLGIRSVKSASAAVPESKTLNFTSGLSAEYNPSTKEIDVSGDTAALTESVLDEIGGASSGTNDAPATQYVNADTGSDAATGLTAETALATLAEARRRIGDKHGGATIYLGGAAGTQYQYACMGRARVGRGILGVEGTAPHEFAFEERNITDITGAVVTFDGAAITPTYHRGWLADFGTEYGCVKENGANTLTLTKAPSGSPTAVSLYVPGIKLVETTYTEALSGAPNLVQKPDYLLLKNVEIYQPSSEAAATGAIQFDRCTVGPGGGDLSIQDAYLRVGDSGVGLSLRGDEFSGQGSLQLANVRGRLSGSLGQLRLYGCGYLSDAQHLYVTGNAVNVRAFQSRVQFGDSVDVFSLNTGGVFHAHGGMTLLDATFDPGAAVAALDEYASVYCNSDLSTFLGVDVSATFTPIHEDWFTVQRLT